MHGEAPSHCHFIHRISAYTMLLKIAIEESVAQKRELGMPHLHQPSRRTVFRNPRAFVPQLSECSRR